MSRRRDVALGLMWGFSIGMAARGLLDYLEAAAHNVRRPAVEPRVVTLSGRRPS